MLRVPPDADPSELSVAARRSLLDALEALDVHRAAVTVVSAQAVYLRSQEADFTVAAFAADGDLALDPERPPAPPPLNDVMEAAVSPLRPGVTLTPSPASGSAPSRLTMPSIRFRST